MNELLNKSIDELVDQLLSEDSLTKSALDIKNDSKTTADAAVNQAPSLQNDDARGAGRPKQISDVPNKDEDGKRDGQFDASIASAQAASDVSEASQVKEPAKMKKSVEITEAEFAEFQDFKKSQETQKIEALKKAEFDKTEALIKSVVEKVSSKYEAKVEKLEKSLSESNALIKSMAAQPVRAKSITGIEALEKSVDRTNAQQETFSKSEVLDAAEECMNKGLITLEQVIELENHGAVYDKSARIHIERQLSSRK